jgi:hypothetical protein
MPARIVEIDCQQALRELVNYMEDDLALELRQQIAHHLAGCRHCTAVYDGVGNVVRLLGEDTAFELPEGFSRRLYQKVAPQLLAQPSFQQHP